MLNASVVARPFAFHHYDGNAVDEDDQVHPASVARPFHCELFDDQKLVVRWLVKVNEADAAADRLAVLGLFNRHPAAEQPIGGVVGVDERRRQRLPQCGNCLANAFVGQAGIDVAELLRRADG